MGGKELPRVDQLVDYNYAVAGHAGTLCDATGDLFIKPCTQSEIDFYASANQEGLEDFAEIMPTFCGTLMLTDPNSASISDAVTGLISETGDIKVDKEQIAASVASQISQAAAANAKDNVTWTPNKDNKIKTDKGVVLENATNGFKRPNILDVKLGKRLWADDAPQQKKERFNKISAETTHGSLGFRIAGMRVYRGSENPDELDKEGYRIYDKDYGRVTVTEDNVVDQFRRFIFNKAARISKKLGRAVCEAFLRDLKNIQEVLEAHETRMYSSSLLFVFEGDGDALYKAIEDNNELVDAEAGIGQAARTTRRVDSGIALDDDDGDDDDDEADVDSDAEPTLPSIYSLKLIDFAHARWMPGQGPDENLLMGVRSLIRIFEEMAA